MYVCMYICMIVCMYVCMYVTCAHIILACNSGNKFIVKLNKIIAVSRSSAGPGASPVGTGKFHATVPATGSGRKNAWMPVHLVLVCGN